MGMDQVKGDCKGTGTDTKDDDCSEAWGVEAIGTGVGVGVKS